tara:strand:+ start:937 stop:1125 length:189 start_codon:yes stop_codon:yes gene_type:complete
MEETIQTITLEQRTLDVPVPPKKNLDIGAQLESYGKLQPTIGVPDVYELELDMAYGANGKEE